jgi:hypothetical protein
MRLVEARKAHQSIQIAFIPVRLVTTDARPPAALTAQSFDRREQSLLANLFSGWRQTERMTIQNSSGQWCRGCTMRRVMRKGLRVMRRRCGHWICS